MYEYHHECASEYHTAPSSGFLGSHSFDDYERRVLKEEIAKLKAAVQMAAPGAPPPEEADDGTDASLIVSIIAIILSGLFISLGTFALLKRPAGGSKEAVGSAWTTYGNTAG